MARIVLYKAPVRLRLVFSPSRWQATTSGCLRRPPRYRYQTHTEDMASVHHYSCYISEEQNRRVNRWLDEADKFISLEDIEYHKIGGLVTWDFSPMVQEQPAPTEAEGQRPRTEKPPPIPARTPL